MTAPCGTYLGPAGPVTLTRRPLAAATGHDEAWLQAQLAAHPHLVPLDEIEPGAGAFVPVCTELRLPGAVSNVRLDLFGVTPTGRVVLVECKLWRNPEARREVIGQILEYAAILARWTYAELEAHLKHVLGWRGENPLYHHVRERVGALDEARFVDAVHRALARGEFLLVVAGDGIRSDARRIAQLLEGAGGLAPRLALLEIQLWHDDAGGVVLLPSLAARTEVVRHRVLVDLQGLPLPVGDAEEAALPPPSAAGAPGGTLLAKRAANRAFWQRFIDELELEHPGQPGARHLANNAVRLPLPAPASGLTVYRAESEQLMGAFARLAGDAGADLYEQLRDDAALAAEIEAALGAPLRLTERATPAGAQYTVGVRVPVDVADPATEPRQREWLARAANAMVNALRPRLERLGQGTE